MKTPETSGIFTYVEILVRWWRFLVFTLVGIVLLGALILLLLPNWYKSTVALLPPRQTDLFSSLGGAGSLLKSLAGGSKLPGMGQRSGGYNYFALLKSRTAGEDMVRTFNLMAVYDIADSSMDKAVKALGDNVAFEDHPDEFITIEVYDRDPQRAADMANHFVTILNRLNTDLGTREARSNREFIEARLEETKALLRVAEDSLRTFQEKTGMMISPEQTEGLSSIASLYAAKAKKEIEIAVLERTGAANDQMLQLLRLEVAELDRKVQKFPAIGLGSLRLYRDVIIQQKIMELLVPMVEQARIEERRDTPVLLVLDRARAAERKSKPQRTLILLIISTLTVLTLVPLAFLFDGLLARGGAGNSVHRWLWKRAQWIAKVFRVRSPAVVVAE
jgi:uncharacterized protein involved in exopolysaccharide biosynthesis